MELLQILLIQIIQTVLNDLNCIHGDILGNLLLHIVHVLNEWSEEMHHDV